MTEQPPEESAPKPDVRKRMRMSYRLTVSLVTARDDRDLKTQLVQEAIDAMPTATYEDMVQVAKMYAATTLMLTSYVAGLANLVGDNVDDRLRDTIRTELLDDL